MLDFFFVFCTTIYQFQGCCCLIHIKMNFPVLVLLLVSSAYSAEFYSANDLEASRMISAEMERAGISTRVMESVIIQKISDLLNSIPTYTEYSNLTLNILNDTIRVTGDLEDTTILGLDNHVIDRCKFGVLPITFAVHVGLPNVNTSGLYDVDGLFGKIIPIYGKGKQFINVKDVSFFIKVDITSVSGQLIIKNVDLELSVGDLQFQLENFMGGDLGKVVCEIIEENFSEYLARVLYWYGAQIENTITTVGNTFLEGKTINDILGWLQGQTTTPKPVTSPKPIY